MNLEYLKLQLPELPTLEVQDLQRLLQPNTTLTQLVYPVGSQADIIQSAAHGIPFQTVQGFKAIIRDND